jgi:DNA-binding NarL/FixJ family response regulator
MGRHRWCRKDTGEPARPRSILPLQSAAATVPRRRTPSEHPRARPRPRAGARAASTAIPEGPRRVATAVAAGPALFAEALCRSLEADATLEVVGRVTSDSEIARLLSRLEAGVLLFDYEALGPGGESTVRRLRREFPSIRILVLASRSGTEIVERVLRAGASGLIGKETDLVTLSRALRAVDSGELWANRRVTALAFERLSRAPESRPAAEGDLTPRESDIAAWVARGLRNKEIAQRMGIHEKTVKTHLNNIFRKLRVDNRVALVLRGAVQPKS